MTKAMTDGGDRLRWELGGLGDPDSGELGRSANPHSSWLAPAEVWLGTEPGWRDMLFWRPPRLDGTESFGEGRVDAAAVERFCALRTGANADVLRFAQRYGVLGLCQHGLPHGHGVTRGVVPSHERCRYMGDPVTGWWEPLDHWRKWAADATAMLNIGSQLAHGKLGEPADWTTLHGAEPFWLDDGPEVWGDLVAFEGHQLAEELNGWLGVGGVRFDAAWNPTTAAVVVSTAGRSLLGAVALQLVLMLAGGKGYAVCDGCPSIFTPSRRPRQDRRGYCPECVRKVRNRQAKRRQRAGQDTMAP